MIRLAKPWIGEDEQRAVAEANESWFASQGIIVSSIDREGLADGVVVEIEQP
mgnify:CR=1 FL=1